MRRNRLKERKRGIGYHFRKNVIETTPALSIERQQKNQD
jgi:hypothetical protein